MESPALTRGPGRVDLLAPLIAVAAAGVMFGAALWPGLTLQGGDLALWVPQFVQTYREGLFFPRWFPYFYAGLPQQFQFLSHAGFTMVLTTPFQFHAVQFALDVVIASVGMWCLLRSWRLRIPACAAGALAYPLSNHLLTWVQAGHLWKYDTTCWTPWLLLALGRAHATGRVTWFLWSGVFLGLHLLGGDVQLAYYVGLVLAALTAARLIARFRQAPAPRPRVMLRQGLGHVLCLVIAAGFGAEVIQHYVHLLRTQEVVVEPGDTDHWRFATEFSLPPEETLGLAVGGGIFGYSLDGPHYWGRSVARATDDYLGIVALCFALCAVYVQRDRRALGWAGIALFALCLAYGKYFPVFYRAVHALPFMSVLRNPNRWLFVTAWAVAILAALGVDAWLAAADEERVRRRLRDVALAVAGLAGVACVAVLLQRVAPGWWRDRLYPWLSRGDADVGEVARRLQALHGEMWRAVLLLSAWLGFTGGWLLRPQPWPRVGRVGMGVACVLLVGGDLADHAQPFIRTYNAELAFRRTPLVEALLSPAERGRTKLWSENAPLRHVVNHQFPYFGIPSVDVISSRRPPEYTALLGAWRSGALPTPLVLRLFQVTSLLSVRALPFDAPAADPVGVFDGVYLSALRDAVPRAEVIGDFNVLDGAAILRRMGQPDFDPAAELLLEERPPVRLDAYSGAVEGAARLVEETPHRLRFTVTASRPAMVLVHDLFDPYWGAEVDGVAAPVLRANGMLRAIPVPRGTDLPLTLQYRPPRWPWFLTMGGWVVVVCGGLSSVLRWRQRRMREAVEGA